MAKKLSFEAVKRMGLSSKGMLTGVGNCKHFLGWLKSCQKKRAAPCRATHSLPTASCVRVMVTAHAT